MGDTRRVSLLHEIEWTNTARTYPVESLEALTKLISDEEEKEATEPIEADDDIPF